MTARGSARCPFVMSTADVFASAYLAEIINERDASRRREAITRLIHPDICHVSFGAAVYGRAEFEKRVDRMIAPIPARVRAGLEGAPSAERHTVFFRWRLAEDGTPPVATGAAFVVLEAGLATWFYATLSMDDREGIGRAGGT